jgi:predicted amidohydrolase
MKDTVTLCSIQPLRCRDNFDEATRHIKRLMYRLDGTPDVILFPEYWNSIRSLEQVTSLKEASLSFLEETAVKLHAFVIAAHLEEEDGHIYNRCHVIDSNGASMGHYDKHHPFGHERERGIHAGVSEYFFHINGYKAGLRICSDLWHGKEFQSLIEEEVALVFVPALTVITDRDHVKYGREMWHFLSTIRAKEGCMAVCVSDAAAGKLDGNYFTAGASCIVDPSLRYTNTKTLSTTLLTSVAGGKEGYCIKEISLISIKEYRRYRKMMGLLS